MATVKISKFESLIENEKWALKEHEFAEEEREDFFRNVYKEEYLRGNQGLILNQFLPSSLKFTGRIVDFRPKTFVNTFTDFEF